MNQSTDIIAIVLFCNFLSIIIYGIIKRKRKLFLFGLCLYNMTPIIRESLAYAVDDNLIHLVIILTFMVLIILCLPVSTAYGANNQAAVALSKKIGVAIVITNLFTGYLILNGELDVEPIFGYFHLVIVAVIIYVIIITSQKKKLMWN